LNCFIALFHHFLEEHRNEVPIWLETESKTKHGSFTHLTKTKHVNYEVCTKQTTLEVQFLSKIALNYCMLGIKVLRAKRIHNVNRKLFRHKFLGLTMEYI
jgi:hypothetical protein